MPPDTGWNGILRTGRTNALMGVHARVCHD